MEPYTCRISRDGCDLEWDAFLANCDDGHHMQTSLWGKLKGCYGWQVFRLIVSDGQRIVGGAQVLEHVGRWGRVGYVARGPAVAAGIPNVAEFTLQQLDRAAVTEKLTYLAVAPPYQGNQFEDGLRRLGFRRKPDALPPKGVMGATLILDLSSNFDDLMAQMRTKTRQHLRRAARENRVTVREGVAEEVETFRQLMLAFCERTGVAPNPSQKDFFEQLWRIFRPYGFIRLFVAEVDSRIVSAVMAFAFGNTVRIWKIGWAGDYAQLHPNDVLHWEMIRWSKLNGFRFFDFVQIDKSLALAILSGVPVDWTTVPGRSYFKAGFGGIPLVLPDTYYRFYPPLVNLALQAGGFKFLESAAAAKLLTLLGSGRSPGQEL